MLDYGIIGNCLTCALVKDNASIDWFCAPRFDSPSIFAKILDKDNGGSLEIKNVSEYKISQKYIDRTAILETTFVHKKKRLSFVVYDFFPRYKSLTKNKHSKLIKKNRLIRIIKPLIGKPEISVKYDPKPNYANEDYLIEENDGKLVCKSDSMKFSLISNIPYPDILKNGKFKLDTTKYVVIGDTPLDDEKYTVKRCNQLLSATKRYWKEWTNTLVTPEFNKEMIIRSAITLKLLTYSETGAVIAAATTSIPEEIGTDRTFDYRFCWVRDAAFAVDALKKIGRNYEPKKLMEFIIDIVLKNDYIQIIYGIGGETRLKEIELKHLKGFKDSRPVRVGNWSYNAVQNDIYGEIIDILYLYFSYYKYEKRMSKKYWRFIVYLVNQIKFNWEKKDSGIWEFRGQKRHYTYSKFMCYIGVDRAIKLAQDYNMMERLHDWIELRQEIKEDILNKAYNKDVEAFTMFYGSDVLDAAVLQMTYYEFLPNDDPRIIHTVKAIYQKLRHDYMVQRYDIQDDFGKSKSSFTICSFWLVDALFNIGEIDKAREIFNKLTSHANHLGLFSEDIDIATKKLIGNFPQAYTHIALINSSILLSEWSARRKMIDWSTLPKRRNWF